MLIALGTETSRPSSAAQVIASIACAEIPVEQWQDLIPKLVNNVTSPQSGDQVKEAALETIGYMCADMVSSWLCKFSDCWCGF